jgi:hypothetical protein
MTKLLRHGAAAKTSKATATKHPESCHQLGSFGGGFQNDGGSRLALQFGSHGVARRSNLGDHRTILLNWRSSSPTPRIS